jgi:hypothetical protein
MVPKNLNDEKARRIEMSAKMLEQLVTEPDFLNRVITVKKIGFSNMTLKPRGRVRNGTQHNLHDRRKFV